MLDSSLLFFIFQNGVNCESVEQKENHTKPNLKGEILFRFKSITTTMAEKLNKKGAIQKECKLLHNIKV